jgi:acetolactate synthase-1/2/3 large subunit
LLNTGANVEESYETVAEYVIRYVSEQGLKHVFLLPGGGCMYLVDALAKNRSINSIPMLHEQSVGIAAEAYAQFNSSPSVALVTTGPGATNAITPCAAAWADSTPVIYISGQVKQSDDASVMGMRQKGFQETPIVDIVKPITKLAIKLKSAEEVHRVLPLLWSEAISDRPGPVWLDIPLNLQAQRLSKPDMEIGRIDNQDVRAKKKFQRREFDLQVLVDDWKNAKRPVILLGNGVRFSNSQKLVVDIARNLNTPILLTWKAIDFLDEHDKLNAGRPGAIAQRWSNLAQQNSDFLLSIGARLDTGQTSYRLDTFARHAKKYVVDVDLAEISKFGDDWTSYCTSAEDFLDNLNQKISEMRLAPKSNTWIDKILEWKRKYPIGNQQPSIDDDGVDLYQFISAFSNTLTAEDVFAPGSSGACSELSMQAFKVKFGQRVLNSEGLGPMGFGIPGAIGVCIASGKKKTYCIDGDGGFLMNIQELATVELHNLPIVFFVLNNQGYGSIKSSQDNYFEGRRLGTDPASGLGLPSIKKLSHAFNINYLKIAQNDDVNLVLEEASNFRGPLIVEIKVSSTYKTHPRTTTYVDSSGNLVTSPMEDLSPLLSLEVLENEMLIPLLPESISRFRD